MHARSFSIRNGNFYIYPDHLEIEDWGWKGWLYRVLTRLGIKRALVLNFLMILAFGAALGVALWIENYLLAFFFSVMGLYYFFLLWRDRDLSFLPVIPRKDIQEVIFHEAVEGESRAFFVIRFSSRRGGAMRRIIQLPIARDRAEMLAQSAYMMLKEEGLL